jgi:PAS domain S-box-containing protein
MPEKIDAAGWWGLGRERGGHRAADQTVGQAITQILDSITDSFIALDGEARFTYLNRQAERFFGKDRTELVGRILWEEYPEALASPLHEHFRRVIESRTAVECEEFYRPKSRWLEIRAFPAGPGVTVYFRDITRRKRAEDEQVRLLARERSAVAAAEIAVRARHDFLRGVAHDLKSPLTAIRGYAQLARMRLRRHDPAGQERLGDYLLRIEQTVDRLNGMVTEFVDLARAQADQLIVLKRRPTDLAALTAEIVDECQGLAAGRLDLQAPPAPLIGHWDPRQLDRAIANLVTNAAKFSPGGDRVSVLLERQDDPGGAWAVLRVIDRGVGIAPDDLPHIFEPFSRGRTAAEYPGSGIGLTSTRHIIELHGGNVTAQSELGQGSTFTIRLPLGPLGADSVVG